MGRFINADTYASTGTGPLGYNMFAYCNNNPVMNHDLHGDTTTGFNVGFSFTAFGYGFSGTLSLVFSDMDWGLQFTKHIENDEDENEDATQHQNQNLGFDLGGNVGMFFTEKTSISELEGITRVIGGDVLLGGDILLGENNNYLGWQWGISNLSGGVHDITTETETIFKLPTINLPKKFKDWGWMK